MSMAVRTSHVSLTVASHPSKIFVGSVRRVLPSRGFLEHLSQVVFDSGHQLAMLGVSSVLGAEVFGVNVRLLGRLTVVDVLIGLSVANTAAG